MHAGGRRGGGDDFRGADGLKPVSRGRSVVVLELSITQQGVVRCALAFASAWFVLLTSGASSFLVEEF